MGSELRQLIDAYDEAVKEGRVLSGKNSAKIREAMDTLHAVLRAAGLMPDDEGDKAVDESDEKDMPMMADAPEPYGGAQSFDELDTFMEVREEQSAIRYTMHCAQDLMNNIMADDDLDANEKSMKLKALAEALPDRIAEPPDYAYKDVAKPGIVDRVRALFRGEGEKMVRKEGGKVVLYSKDGKKKLGEYDSEEGAAKREAQVEYFKKKKKDDEDDDLIEVDVDGVYDLLVGEKHPTRSPHSHKKGGGGRAPSAGAGPGGNDPRVGKKPNAKMPTFPGRKVSPGKRKQLGRERALDEGATPVTRRDLDYLSSKRKDDDVFDDLIEARA